MSYSASTYGGSISMATDLDVNTGVDFLAMRPPQLPYLVNLPYAGFSLFNVDQTNPLTYDFNGTTSHVTGELKVTFTFTVPLNNTNYVIRGAPSRFITGITNKTINGFVAEYTTPYSAGFTILVFEDGQV